MEGGVKVVDRKAELGFSFVCPSGSGNVVEVLFALNKLKLTEVPTVYISIGYEEYEAGVEITGKCQNQQDVAVAQAVLDAGQVTGNINLIRRTVITFEDLSKRELLQGGGVRTVVHQIAIRSLIRGIEED